MTTRLRDAVERIQRLTETLDELGEVIGAPPADYTGPFDFPVPRALKVERAIQPECLLETCEPLPAKRRVTALSKRGVRAAGVAVLPLTLASALAMFGILRLQPANTLWSQELTLSSNVGTGEFGCDPITLQFTGLTHPAEGQTRLTYRLSGGGTNGPGCQTKDISNLSVAVCFDPEIDDGNPISGEGHPGIGTQAWKYAPKGSSSPKLVKWDSKTTSAPLGGKGPFDPDQMEFSLTFDLQLTETDLIDGLAKFKAGSAETSAGVVKVPGCPLPKTDGSNNKSTSGGQPEASAEPNGAEAATPPPSPAGGAANVTPTPTRTATPRPPATPTTRAPRAEFTGVAIYPK